MDEAGGESTRWKCLFVLIARVFARRGWMWVAKVNLETGGALLNEEGGEVGREVTMFDVHSNMGSGFAVGGVWIGVGGVYERLSLI
jgi:hypothetical protein